MNIVLASLLYKPNIGGIENSISYLANEYKLQGHHVEIITSTFPERYNLAPEEIVDGVKISRFRWNEKVIFPFSILYNLISLTRFLRKFRSKNESDIFISRHHFICIGAWLSNHSKIIYLVPEVIKRPKMTSCFTKEGFVDYINSLFQYIGVKCCDKVFVFSENVKNQLQALGTIKDLQIVKPGVDVRKFSDYSKLQARTILNLDLKKKVFLAVGRFIPRKGFDVAIKAFHRMRDDNSILILVGEGPEKANYLALIEQLDLRTNVLVCGKSDQVEVYYKASDVFLMTSYNEPFGQTILEAMASSLGIVAFTNSEENGVKTASSEILEDQLGAIFCDPNVESLSMAMTFITQNDRYSAMGEYNNAVSQNYSWKQLSFDLLK